MIKKVLIRGAAGRDFHNFNLYFKDNPDYLVVAFTAAQIPLVQDRIYPPDWLGSHRYHPWGPELPPISESS